MNGTCLRCRRATAIHARGLCRTCHKEAQRAGTLNRWPLTDERREARERAIVIEAHLRSGLTRAEVADLMGVSWDTVNGVARRKHIPVIPPPDGSTPPAEPACAGTNHPGFILETQNRRVTAGDRDLLSEALTYCDRCPLQTQQWCHRFINPTRTRWTGIAGGQVYIDGQPRPDLALEAVS